MVRHLDRLGQSPSRSESRGGRLAGASAEASPPQEGATTAVLGLPARHYYLLHGPIEGALETMMSRGYEGFSDPWQSMNLWWPDDRAWFVSTEIDFAWTYVGGTPKLINDLMADERLEVLRAQPGHEVTADSDQVNPPHHDDQ